jgi:hypothetical protein
MADFNNSSQNVVRLRSATNTGGGALVHLKPKINISQLARETSRRSEVRAMADPQAQALHVGSNTVRTVQAAAMVGMCLAAGYIIAFGAGLIWPRS